MVKGLDKFKEFFSGYTDNYVLIGGTACSIIMEEVGLNFRATKDLDIVLYVEALDNDFTSMFWEFIDLGGYQNRQRSTGKEVCYRFHSPKMQEFPLMIELFSRNPNLELVNNNQLTPIPVDDLNTSLSAILLEESLINAARPLFHSFSPKKQFSKLLTVNSI